MSMPSIGRIVVYFPKAGSKEAANDVTIVPAIVTRVHLGPYNEVNLRVFTDGPETTWLENVPYSDKTEPGTWSWPARV